METKKNALRFKVLASAMGEKEIKAIMCLSNGLWNRAACKVLTRPCGNNYFCILIAVK